MNMSLEVCREECLKDYSCSAYATANMSGSGWLSWYRDLMDTRMHPEGGQDLYVCGGNHSLVYLLTFNFRVSWIASLRFIRSFFMFFFLS